MSEFSELFEEAKRRGIVTPEMEALVGEAQKRGIVGKQDNYASGLARTIAQGVSLGFGDEIEAGIRSLFSDDDYSQIVGKIRNDIKAFSDANPKTAITAEIGGGLLTGGAGAARALGSQVVRQGGRLLKAAALPAVGAAEGGVAGAGTSTEGNRLRGAAVGAGIGASLGAALPIAGAVVNKAVIQPIASRLPGGRSVNAAEFIGRNLDRDNLTPEQALARVDEIGPGAALVDAGENVKGLGGVVANRPGESKRIVRDFVEDRRDSQSGRILDKLDRAVSRPGKELAEVVEDSSAFRESLGIFVPVTNDLVRVMQRPTVRRAFAKASKGVKETDQSVSIDGVELSMDDVIERISSGEIKEISTALLHRIKKGLDDVIEPKRNQFGKLETNFGKNELFDAQSTRAEFRGIVKDLNPQYGAQLDRLSANNRLDDAFRKGEDFFKLRNPRAVARQLKSMTPTERRSYQRGVVRAIEDKIGGPAEVNQDVSKIVARQAKKLRVAFGRNGEKLVKDLKGEVDLARNNNDLVGGSPTQPRQVAAADFEGGAAARVAGDVVTGNRAGLLSRAADTASQVVFGPGEGVAKTISELLTSTNPRDRERILQLLARSQNSAGGVPGLGTAGHVVLGGAATQGGLIGGR